MGIDESDILFAAALGGVLPYAITAIVEWTQRHDVMRGHHLSLPRFGHRHREFG